MSEQDNAFSNAYDKKYITDKAAEPKNNKIRNVDKSLEVMKEKGQMIAEEQALLKK